MCFSRLLEVAIQVFEVFSYQKQRCFRYPCMCLLAHRCTFFSGDYLGVRWLGHRIWPLPFHQIIPNHFPRGLCHCTLPAAAPESTLGHTYRCPLTFQTYSWPRGCWFMASHCEFKWHDEVEHFCLCLMLIQLSCSVKHMEGSFLFANWVDFFMPTRKISLYIMVIRPFVAYMCSGTHLLIRDLFSDEWKFLFLKQLNLSTISFMDCTFCIQFIPFPSPGSRRQSPKLYSKSAFRYLSHLNLRVHLEMIVMSVWYDGFMVVFPTRGYPVVHVSPCHVLKSSLSLWLHVLLCLKSDARMWVRESVGNYF